MLSRELNVVLVGPMGSGKTTIGKLVADDLGLEFHDCDQDLEKRTGASVNLIFDIEGESGFRKRETALLKSLSRKKGILIATGGGIVTIEENRRIIRRSGLVVWLETTVEQQLKRLSHDKTRPLLQIDDRESTLRQLAAQREPFYREVCDIRFQSPNRNSKYAAQQLAALIREARSQPGTGSANHA